MITNNGSIRKNTQKETAFASLEEALKWAGEQIDENALRTSLYVSPKIPAKKSRNAIKKYAKGISENDILLLHDSTVFGSGKNGVVLTKDHLYWGQDRLTGNAPLSVIKMKQISNSSMMVVADREVYRVVMSRSDLNIAIFRKLMEYLDKSRNSAEDPDEAPGESVGV